MGDNVGRNKYQAGDISGGISAFGDNAQININISTFSEFSSIDEKTKAKLLVTYQSAIGSASNSAQLNLAVGLHYLDSGLYTESIEALQLARRSDPLNKNVLYYLALATVAGKPLRSATLTEIREAEEYLRAAMQLQPAPAHYYYLWCLIKLDFYQANGFRETAPPIDKLFLLAQNSDLAIEEIKLLLSNVNVASSPEVEYLLNSIT